MSKTVSAKYALGPCKFNATNVAPGLAAGLLFLVITLGIAYLVLAFWLILHNIMIAYQGDATVWNFGFILLGLVMLFNTRSRD